MRTVHENEGPRTAECYPRAPYPRATTGANTPTTDQVVAVAPPPPSAPGDKTNDSTPSHTVSKPSGLKLKLNLNGKPKASPTASNDLDFLDEIQTAPLTPLSPHTKDEVFGALPKDLEFDEYETLLDRRRLFFLLRQQLQWAEQEGKELDQQVAELEAERRKEWLAKELVMENVLEAEYATADRRGVFDDSGSDLTFGEIPDELTWNGRLGAESKVKAQREKEKILELLDKDAMVANQLPMRGASAPWYRDQNVVEERRKRKLEDDLDGLEKAKQALNDRQVAQGDDAGMMDGDETEEEADL